MPKLNITLVPVPHHQAPTPQQLRRKREKKEEKKRLALVSRNKSKYSLRNKPTPDRKESLPSQSNPAADEEVKDDVLVIGGDGGEV